ncbi:SDR family NAD(P)-dependent oxidoreductase [Burkholderia sp. MSMB1072]|uniref:SDR family NAD(P)-dependent oxidoreductase n=1 Tax=Burkholderia sp. MSMB1072 TaxID=1637871 RepID=UPI0009EA0F7F|nr:SDR family NAD(P)-dependent oxidoreductase [Burkholderia sp. MSMB1072]
MTIKLSKSTKVTLVTGASGGIGRAVALRLAAAGFAVVGRRAESSPRPMRWSPRSRVVMVQFDSGAIEKCKKIMQNCRWSRRSRMSLR